MMVKIFTYRVIQSEMTQRMETFGVIKEYPLG